MVVIHYFFQFSFLFVDPFDIGLKYVKSGMFLWLFLTERLFPSLFSLFSVFTLSFCQPIRMAWTSLADLANWVDQLSPAGTLLNGSPCQPV